MSMSILDDELCERYPLMSVEQLKELKLTSDAVSQLQRVAYRAGRLKSPTDAELDAAARVMWDWLFKPTLDVSFDAAGEAKDARQLFCGNVVEAMVKAMHLKVRQR